jgi:hypothetical protein
MTYTPFQDEDEETGLILKIMLDDSGSTESPLEHDGAVIMAALHRNYVNPGAAHGLKDQEAIERFERENCRGKSAQWVAFPLFLFDHSGTVYKVAAPVPAGERPANPFGSGMYAQFDSGRLGTLFVNLKELCKSNTPRAEKLAAAAECARVTCEVYTAWANGEVYGYSVEDQDGETLDSCWGYIGPWDDAYLMDEAKGAFEAEKAKARKELAGEMEAARPDMHA